MKRLRTVLILTPKSTRSISTIYAGDFPGSWAKGELYNYDPATGDARSCGTTASLCGVEQALESGDVIALDYAVRRDLLLHSVMAFLQGFPMLNSGDEIAQLNGWIISPTPIGQTTAATCTAVRLTGKTQNSAPKRVRCRTSCGRAWKNCAKCGQTSALPRTHG